MNYNMRTNKNNWTLGEVVEIPRMERQITKSGSMSYEQYVGKSYVCVREENGAQCGLLLRVLGRATTEHIKIKGGLPFCFDDCEEQFYATRYFSHPFPSRSNVDQVLRILRDNPQLMQQLESVSRAIDLDSMFWVKNVGRDFFFRKRLQYLDARTGELYTASSNQLCYRLSIVRFYKGDLIW